jgi:two-component system, OmpR family, response regulator
MPKSNVLVVDDNAELREVIRENLEMDGYDVNAAATAEETLALLRACRPDTILLDLMLPDDDGLALIGRIRQLTAAPIIVISGKNAWVDKVVGLEVGADDYLGKPFEMKELSARVKASIRRYRARNEMPAAETQKRIRFGEWVLDQRRLQIFNGEGKPGELTVMEFRLLEALVLAPNCVLSREQLLDKARADSLAVFDRAIDIQITRIRKKIGDDPKMPHIIKTIRGAGYMLACGTETLL